MWTNAVLFQGRLGKWLVCAGASFSGREKRNPFPFVSRLFRSFHSCQRSKRERVKEQQEGREEAKREVHGEEAGEMPGAEAGSGAGFGGKENEGPMVGGGAGSTEAPFRRGSLPQAPPAIHSTALMSSVTV